MVDLLDVIAQNAATRPTKTAFVFEEERLTFREFAEAVARTAAGFRDQEIRPGDHVVIACYHGNAVVVTYYALLWLGAVPVLASASLLDDLPAIVRATDARALVYGPQARPLLAGGPPPGVRLLVAADGSDGRGVPLAALAQRAPIPAVPRHPDQPSGIVFSGGTTGRPKPILRTIGSDLWDGILKLLAYRLGLHDVYLYPSPLNLTALLGPTRQTLLAGATYVVIDGFVPERVAAICARERVSQLTLLPGQWAELLARPELDRADLSSLRQLGLSAGHAPAALRQQLQERFPSLPLLQVYGTSETGPIAAVQDPDPFAGEPHYVGRPLAAVQVRIEAEGGTVLSPGEVGEIVVRTPAAAAGYYRQPEASARTFREGWVATGDLGWHQEDGRLSLIGRASEVFILAGQRVYPSVVQEVLAARNGVQEAVCLGLPRAEPRQLVVFVVPRRGALLPIEELRQAVARRLVGVPADRMSVVVVPTLPRTSAGKVDARALEKQWAARCSVDMIAE
ncbi:MAG: acyl--CoA ligase [Chloroflexi bacterium]|nr:acyl--CoA ligase [Chloroflexota bacterium]